MPTGYTFKGKGSTKARRLAVHKNAIHEQGGKMTGYNVGLMVAQDQESAFEPQGDTRVQYEIFDKDLAKESGYKQGVDNTVALSAKQVEKIKEIGDHGPDNDYLVFEADVMFTDRGAIPNTKTMKAVDEPFNKAQHDITTAAARAERAKTAVAEKEAPVTEADDDLEL